MSGSMCHLSVIKLQTSVDIMRYYEWPKVKKYLNKQLHKAVSECKNHANNAKNFVGNIESKKWPLKKIKKKSQKKTRKGVYTVNRSENGDDDGDADGQQDEYLSWGSDFDTDSDTNPGECSGSDEEGGEEDEDEETHDDVLNVDDDNDTIRCGSYTFSDNGRTSSNSSTRRDDGISVATSSNSGFNYENTYEAISETPSTSSYGAGSENSSSLYETPSEGASRCDEVDSHPDLDGDHINHHSLHSRASFLHPDDDKVSHISAYSESEYSDVMKKETSASSETSSSSGLGSESSGRVKESPMKKPPIPPKPSLLIRSKVPPVLSKVRSRPPDDPPPPPAHASSSSSSSSSPSTTCNTLNPVSSSSFLSSSKSCSSSLSTSPLPKSVSSQSISNEKPTSGSSSSSSLANSELTLTLEDLDEALKYAENIPSESVSSKVLSDEHDPHKQQHKGLVLQSGSQSKNIHEDYETPIHIRKQETSSSYRLSSVTLGSVPSSVNTNSIATTRTLASEPATRNEDINTPPISPPPQFDDKYCCSCRRLKSIASTPNLQSDSLARLNEPAWLKQSRNNLHSSTSTTSHFLSSSMSHISPLDVDRPRLPRNKSDNHHSSSNSVSLASKLTEKAKTSRWLGSHYKSHSNHHHNQRNETNESTYINGHHVSSSSIFTRKFANSNNNNSSNNCKNNSTHLANRPLPPLPDNDDDYNHYNGGNNCKQLEIYEWFHNVERDFATNLLKKIGSNGTYLIRPSRRAGSSNPFSLTIFNNSKVLNINVRQRSDGLFALGKEKDKERTFNSVPDLVRFHQQEPIILTTNGESAGITKLVCPLSKKLYIA